MPPDSSPAFERAVPPAEIVAVVNTADDEEFHGLYVSPDLDSVTYTLAGASNSVQGWGLEGETFATLEALQRYKSDAWFRLGDKDLATHLYRSERLRAGASLSEVTAEIAAAWGLEVRLLPMTDDPVRTRITVRDPDGGLRVLKMQEWFVRERAEPEVVQVDFAGADAAAPAAGVLDALEQAGTILVCPSNPVISIGPILAVPGSAPRSSAAGPGRRREPDRRRCTVKGPADRLMGPLGHRGVVRRRGARLRGVLQHARHRRRRRAPRAGGRGRRRPRGGHRHDDAQPRGRRGPGAARTRGRRLIS